MAPPARVMLPSSTELALLSDEKVKVLANLTDNEGRRLNAYAIVGMLCGTLSFLGSLSAFVYLVMNNHDKAADVVLGTTVIAIISRMIRGR